MAGATKAILKGCALVALIGLAACDQKNAYVAPPPPKVTVAAPVERAVTVYLEATGNTAAVNTTNLVARVPGFLETVNYQDGAMVKKGTVLFTIEPETYDLKLKQAQAAEASAQATVKQTQAEYERQAELTAKGSASKSTLDNAVASRDTAQANLQQAQINTKLAALNVDYASVKAPFDGTVTARKYSIGEYVGANSSPTVLATIVQLDPIYANFSINERDVLRIRAEIRKRGLTPEDLQEGAGRDRSADRAGLPAQGHARLRLAHGRPDHRHAGGARHLRKPEQRAAARPVRTRAHPDRHRQRRAAWCPTSRSAPTRAAAICWSSTRTTSSSSAASRSARSRARCG